MRLRIAITKASIVPSIRQIAITVWHGAVSIILITLVALLIARLEVLPGLEIQLLDWANSIHLRKVQAGTNRIIVVAITDDEWEEEFQEQSPLGERLIQDLIQLEKTKDGPKLIVVDLDTSDRRYNDAPAELDATVPRWHSKFLWAASNRQGDTSKASAVLGHSERNPEDCINKDADISCQLLNESGPTVFPTERDSMIRAYYRQFVMPVSGRVYTLVSKAAGRFDPSLHLHTETIQPEAADDRERLMRWTGTSPIQDQCVQPKTPSGRFLECSMRAALAHPADLAGKLVIVGGMYEGDRHPTPNGPRWGVEVMAEQVGTELEGGGPVLPSEGVSVLIAAIIGVVLTFAIRAGTLVGLLASLISALILWVIFLEKPDLSAGFFFPIPLVFWLIHWFAQLYEFREKTIAELVERPHVHELVKRVRAWLW
jgi:CHASE2 domain-containing sensor protein